MPDVDLANFGSRTSINPPGGYQGADIASAATITLSRPVHKITGTVEITTINPPYTGFVGHMTLLCGAAFTFATGGNILKAFTAVANEFIDIYYDGSNWWLGIAD